MGINKKTVAYIWCVNKQHFNWQAAVKSGVCEIIEIDSTSPTRHIGNIREIVLTSNRLTTKEGTTLKLEIVHWKKYAVSAEVLEWTRYTVDVWAHSEEAANQQVKDKGILNFDVQDVAYGSAFCDSDETTDDRNHSVT